MNGRREKGKGRGKEARLRKYDPLDFSRFTASENAAGGFFQQTPKRVMEQQDIRQIEDNWRHPAILGTPTSGIPMEERGAVGTGKGWSDEAQSFRRDGSPLAHPETHWRPQVSFLQIRWR